MDFLEYPDVSQEVRGAMNSGRLKLTNQTIIFKNNKTGKVDNIQSSDIEDVFWQRLAVGFGLRVMMKNGSLHRFGGFRDTDLEKLSKFFLHNYSMKLEEKDLSVKGWNWGTAKFLGSVLSFDVSNVTAFEIPLTNVSHCTAAKNEVTLEFHQNDDAAVSLMELRFHIPNDVSEVDAVQAFRDNVMAKASIIQATGDAIATFKELQCLTPRGRYDIKLFPSFIQLHGKTFDYKIPLVTVLRLFLLPHKDQRQMFFVVSLDPPIKQGQTRYPFLILLFSNEEETTIELGLSETDLQEKFEGKLQKEMTGPTYEVISRIMKALVQRKITIPGGFVGNSGSPAISCSYKAAAGLLYPLERGFIYIHKPPIHIRFEEVSSVNFARSGGSTRSFDFEVEIKSGVIHTFSSIEKEEYGKLFDFITGKKLRVKNRGKLDQPNYNEEELVDSDVEEPEPDAYLARVKAEAEERDDLGDDSDEDESDESFNPGESGSEVAEEYDSNPPTSSDDNSDAQDSPSKAEKKKPEKKEKKKKHAKTVPEKRKTKKKKPKDDNKPKRPMSAYFLWLNENRERIKKENPGFSITEVTKRGGEEWKEVKDKTKWEKQSEEAKKEYEKAMAEYKALGLDKKRDSSPEEKKEKKTKEKKKVETPKKTSPQKPGSYKSKEYISSSDSSSEDDKKKAKSKSKKPAKESPASSADESGDDDEKSLKKPSKDESAASSAEDSEGKDSDSD